MRDVEELLLFFFDDLLVICDAYDLVVDNIIDICQLMIGQFELWVDLVRMLIDLLDILRQKRGLRRLLSKLEHLTLQEINVCRRPNSLHFSDFHCI